MNVNDIIGWEDAFRVTEGKLELIGHSVILESRVKKLGLTDEQVLEAARKESKAFLDTFYPGCGEATITYKDKSTFYSNH